MKQNSRVDGVHMHLENKKVSLIFFWIIWLMYTVVYMTKNCYSAAMASIVNEGVLTKSQTGLLRYIVSNGVNTLSATMLMESYDSVSPSIGNILNILILISGVVGITLVNQFVYPRITRNEVTATILLVAAALPFMIVICFVGRVSLPIMMVCLCVSSALLTGAGLLMSHVCAAFAKYGKNGLASGVNNALASIAIVIQSYGVLLVADHAEWKGACYLFVILLIVAIVGALIALPMWNKFINNKLREKEK